MSKTFFDFPKNIFFSSKSVIFGDLSTHSLLKKQKTLKSVWGPLGDFRGPKKEVEYAFPLNMSKTLKWPKGSNVLLMLSGKAYSAF